MTLRRAYRRHGRREPLSAGQRAFLCHGIEGDAATSTVDEHLARRGEALRRVWRANKSGILPDFIRAHPGRRPAAWWTVDAPEPSRRRLGGVGTPCHEVLAYAEENDVGIPVHWVKAWQVEYYSGRAVDVHGQPIGIEHRAGDFRGQAIDMHDAPRYESEATYLKRHGLLGAQESRRLTAADFEPETVEAVEEDGGGDEPRSRFSLAGGVDRCRS